MSAVTQIVLPKLTPRAAVVERISRTILSLAQTSAWRVSIEEWKPPRTTQQNKLLWAIYDEILEKGGEDMGGWTKDDLHEFFLIETFGSETRALFDKKRLIPLRRSSRLNKQEFSDLIETIQRFMAERGVYIETPDEVAA